MTLTDFLTALVREKGVPTEAAGDLFPRLQKFITLNVLTELAAKNSDLLKTFQSLVDKNATAEEIRAFVEKEIPDGAAFLANTLNDFRQLYLYG